MSTNARAGIDTGFEDFLRASLTGAFRGRRFSIQTLNVGEERVLNVEWKDVAADPCPVASTLDLFGDRWSILVVRDVMNGVRRFDALVERLSVSRATLSDRLRRLIAAGILEPADYEDARGRVRTEYRLTEKGWDLRFVLVALREWGDRHVIGAGNEPLRLVERDFGHEVRLALIDRESGAVVDPRRVRQVPGPGFTTRDVAASREERR